MRTIVLLAILVGLSGCAVAPYQGGVVFTGTRAPIDAPDNATGCPKQGSSSQTNILGLFAFGDASVAAAKKSANITRVGTVDYKHTAFLGIFSTTTTLVCGE